MPPITTGTVTKFFLYDVAEAFDLAHVRRLVGSAAAVRVVPKPSMPSYVQYRQAPVSIEGRHAGVMEVDGFAVRFKVFDYGAVSVAMTRRLPDSWERLLSDGVRWHEDPGLAAGAETACRALLARIEPAMSKPRAEFLTEDYLVFVATDLDDVPNAEALLATHGGTIAQLLRGELEPLSSDEREEVLRQRLSYLSTDLVVVTWSSAFICDTEAGAHGILEILEFANSQLLEFRYYDGLLDAELERIYAQLERPPWPQSWFGRRHTRAARHVHTLFVDVTELTDKTENALKIAGDVYAARLFTLIAGRLGLAHWKGTVRDKLKTLDAIYRFAVDHAAMVRGELMELAIVLILVFELGLFFAGVMR